MNFVMPTPDRLHQAAHDADEPSLILSFSLRVTGDISIQRP